MSSVYEIIFSPTHRSQAAADRIASHLLLEGEEIQKSDLCIQKEFSIHPGPEDIAVITVPSYGGRVPAAAAERLSRLKADRTPAVLAVTFGNRAFEDTLIELRDLSVQCGFSVMAACALVASHNIMQEYGRGRPDAEDLRETDQFAQRVLAKRCSGIQSEPELPGNRPYKEWHGSRMTISVNASCISCGICASACPVSAISKNGLSTDPDICIGCMRCVQDCPVHARNLDPDAVKKMTEKMREACSSRKNNSYYL